MSVAQRALNYTGDTVSAAAIVGTFLGFLPGIAALAGIIWYAIQIYESKTVQKWIRLHRYRSRLKRLIARRALSAHTGEVVDLALFATQAGTKDGALAVANEVSKET